MSSEDEGDDSPGQRAGVSWEQHTREPVQRSFRVLPEGGTLEVLRPCGDLYRHGKDGDTGKRRKTRGVARDRENTDVDDDALARSIRESTLSASAQDALQRLRGGPRATKGDSLQARFHAAVRKSTAQSQDDEALLSLVLRVMTRLQSPSKSDLLTSDGLGSTQQMMHEGKHPATSERVAETETYESSDCFEDVYLGMMQHVSAFPQARREGDARDRECLVRALREVLLDANSVLSIKARFAALRATNVGCDGDAFLDEYCGLSDL